MTQKRKLISLVLTLTMVLSTAITASASSYYVAPTYDFDKIAVAPDDSDGWIVTNYLEDGTAQYGMMNTAGEMVVEMSTENPFTSSDEPDLAYLYDMATGALYEGSCFITLDDSGTFQGMFHSTQLLEEPTTHVVVVADGTTDPSGYFSFTEIFGYGVYVNGLITTGDKYFDALTFASDNMLKATTRYGEVTYMDVYGTNLTGAVYEDGTIFATKYDVAAVKIDGLWGFLSNPLPSAKEEVTADVVVTGTATATASPILLNGETVAFDGYFIADNNYFKLRDLAAALDGTGSEFSVEWVQGTQTIHLVTGESYESVGGELELGDGTAKTYATSTASVTVNGEVVALTAYNIEGNNYFKLRDLGDALGFDVDWEESTNTILIDTAG